MQTLCNVDNGSVADYGERLHDLRDLIEATPICELPHFYDPTMGYFLGRVFHHAGNIGIMEFNLSTRMICIRFAEVFNRLCWAGIDCKELSEAAATIAVSFMNQGKTTRTDEICLTTFKNVQQKYPQAIVSHVSTIMFHILKRISGPYLKKEDITNMLVLVELFASSELTWKAVGKFFQIFSLTTFPSWM